LAPCVAVVGPAQSGKTSLLHLLDRALQNRPAAPLAYIVKGNPDGTGRYLLHAPELRKTLKPRVKGAWCETTVSTVREWVDSCRGQLELVLLDVGGKHAPANDVLLRAATHFIVVARRFEDPAVEEAEGMDSWWNVCRRLGLAPVARVRSLWQLGQAEATTLPGGLIEASIRADACGPQDRVNDLPVDRIVKALLALRRARPAPPYLDLRLGRDWVPADLPDLGGLAPRLAALVAAGDTVTLGGRAPLWAYAAALHRALDLRPDAAVAVFDPKVPAGLVEIAARLGGEGEPSLASYVAARWHAAPGGGAALELAITTTDLFIPPEAMRSLASLPLPQGEPPPGRVVADGPSPIWLHLAYSRWLRSLPGGPRTLGVFDVGTRQALFVTGPGAPQAVPWESPVPGPASPPIAGDTGKR
jgi:hypothetical protein